tara:strand:+ start:1488 stop:2663 length:1176 start_codon:yes stop_codon:yes gene_type:complete
MLNTDFSPWPSFTREEADAISEILLSNRVNYFTGQENKKFEKEYANWINCEYAITVANGTVALDLALKALNIGEGDDVIVTPRSFIASISSVVNCKARPIFADIDLSTQNITANNIRSVITKNTKAIICVHLAGYPCEMDEIMDIANEYNVYVIEDCAQAHGAKYKGKSVGSIGHIGCWSFCQDKIITTGGEGGMVTTNEKVFWKRMWAYKDHGKSYEAVYERKHPEGFRWLHDSFGTNWRMTEIQAKIGRIQLKRMAIWHKTRLEYANTIWNTARNCKGLRVPNIPNFIEHAAYKCYVFLKSNDIKNNWNCKKIIKAINDQGVPCYSGSCSEVYLEKAFDETNFKPETRLPNAKELGDTSLMFLVHPSLTQKEIEQTCSVLTSVMKLAVK